MANVTATTVTATMESLSFIIASSALVSEETRREILE